MLKLTELNPSFAALITLILATAVFYAVYFLLSGERPGLGLALFTGAMIAFYQYYRLRKYQARQR